MQLNASISSKLYSEKNSDINYIIHLILEVKNREVLSHHTYSMDYG